MRSPWKGTKLLIIILLSLFVFTNNPASAYADTSYESIIDCMKKIDKDVPKIVEIENESGFDLFGYFGKDIVIVSKKRAGKIGFYLFQNHSAKFISFPSRPHGYFTQNMPSSKEPRVDSDTNYPQYFYVLSPDRDKWSTYIYNPDIYISFWIYPYFELGRVTSASPDPFHAETPEFGNMSDGIDVTNDELANEAIVGELFRRVRLATNHSYIGQETLLDKCNNIEEIK